MTDLINQQSNVAGQTTPEGAKKPIGEFKVHTMPEKFLGYLAKNKMGGAVSGGVAAQKIGGMKRGLIIGISIAVLVVAVLGVAAWLFVKSINQKPAENNVATNNQNTEANANNSQQQAPAEEEQQGAEECSSETCVGCSAEQCRLLSNTCELQNVSEIDSATGEARVQEKCAPIVVPNNDQGQNSTSTPENLDENNPEEEATEAADIDNDGLTDEEERVWGTVATISDSDSDGYVDGLEINNLYDPNKGNSARLGASSAAKQWSDAQNGFSVLYPAAFGAEKKDDGTGATFTDTATGQFFQVAVLENSDNAATIDDWYLSLNPTADLNGILHLTIGGRPAMAADIFSYYVLKGDKVYLLNYNAGYPATSNFLTSFNAFLKSFEFFNNPMPEVN